MRGESLVAAIFGLQSQNILSNFLFANCIEDQGNNPGTESVAPYHSHILDAISDRSLLL
jgi:hypothetical protein